MHTYIYTHIHTIYSTPLHPSLLQLKTELVEFGNQSTDGDAEPKYPEGGATAGGVEGGVETDENDFEIEKNGGESWDLDSEVRESVIVVCVCIYRFTSR